jgi:dihydrofolate synthase/folylpolyglutamate synthase
LAENEQSNTLQRYKETVEWLFGIQRFGSKLGLVNIRHLLGQLGDPQESFKSIHITGTSGKGSTTAMISSILHATGHRVGMFTSPHLSSFTERIRVNGEPIPPGEVVRIVDEIRPHVEEMAETEGLRHPTFFEVITGIAFKYFSEQGVDFAVLEVGMGGRLDATNVVQSLVSVITNVSLEHTYVLGDTVLEIAEKKAGIIKKGGVLITATEDDAVYDLFSDICKEEGSRIFRVGGDIRFKKLRANLEGQWFQYNGLSHRLGELFIPLIGRHQLVNASTAVGAIEALGLHSIQIPEEAIVKGLRRVSWPGRLEVMQESPLVVLDSAKDTEAARAARDAILEEFTYNRLIAVVSISSDKNIPEMIGHLAQIVDHFIVTTHRVMGRAAEPSVITGEVEKHSRSYQIIPSVKDAVEAAVEMAEENDMVIVVGSVFLVGEARELWHKPPYPDPV